MFDLDPIIVTGAVQRIGTTLVQRLLCSDPGTLIFGEGVATELQAGVHLAAYRRITLEQRAAYHEELIADVLGGDVGRWISDLSPPTAGWLETLEGAALAASRHCRDFAAAQGRPNWGCKLAGWSAQSVDSLLGMLPACRVVYLHRDLGDALRSARAVDLVRDGEGVELFCRAWAEGEALRARLAPEPRFLALRYEELVARPEVALQRLADFAGAPGMDAGVLARRINVDRADPRAESPGWVRPAQLSAADQAIVARYAPS